MGLSHIKPGIRNEAGLKAMASDLQARFGDRFQTSQAIRAQHSHTTTWVPSQLPDGVVFVETAEDVKAVVQLADRHEVPLIPFGAGSSLEGQTNAPSGGFSLDFTRMNKVLSVNAEDLDCTVEPGITREDLNAYLPAPTPQSAA